MYQTFVYISAAVIAVPIAKRFGLGSVLGYLLAGVLIGPFIFNFIGEEGESIMHFAEFGVVMMMFLIGLELEPARLWKLRAPILGLGGLQVSVTTLIFTAIFIFFTDLPWQTDLAIGLTLALSSTAIVIQTLEEKGLMQTTGGKNAFSVVLFQDIAIIPILALFPFLATQEPNTLGVQETNWIEGMSLITRSVLTISAIISIIVAGKYLVSPLFRYIAQTGIFELFTATALLLIIGTTILMTQVGLSPALGTFLAGVVLAQSEYKHELETSIKPFKGLLLGLFFIAVGASIDFNLIASQPLFVGGLVAVLITVKFLVLLGVGKLFGMRIDNNLLFAFSLAQGGEFAFVLFSFSLQNGVMTSEITDILTAAVVISMSLTPLFMIIHERIIQSNIGVKKQVKKKKDEPKVATEDSEGESPIIIAGFGRYGSTIGRFMQANNHQATYLDIDPNMVHMMRKMGLKVFYGDASRYDLLATAGAKKAKLLIISVDNEEKSIEIIETAKKYFPHLKIYARASSWPNFQRMIQLKVDKVYREHLDTSMRIAEESLSFLGRPKFQVHRASLKFRKHDDVSFNKLAEEELDQHDFALNRRKFIEELELIIKEDQLNSGLEKEFDWDTGHVREVMGPIIKERYKDKLK